MVSLVDTAVSGLASLASASASEGGQQGGNFLVTAFRQGGPAMYVNLLMLAIVITIVIERTIFQLAKYRVNSKEFFAQIRKLVNANNLDRAIKLCEAGNGSYPILQLVKSGLAVANRGPDEIDSALSEKSAELKPAVEKRVGSLWSLANIATLIGLLGTVFGLIRTFAAVSNPNMPASERQQKLAEGISEAMVNTAFGLFIAVLCMICHLLLNTNAKKIAHDLDSTQERVFNLLAIQRGGQG